MLTAHSQGFGRVLVMCVPQALLKLKHAAHTFHIGDLDVERCQISYGGPRPTGALKGINRESPYKQIYKYILI